MRSDRGVAWESAVVVRVPALDETIATLRRRFELPRKANGIPPHVTVIVPFLPRVRLTEEEDLPALRALCARFEPFDVRLAHTARFRRVLYLAPEPAAPFLALTRALTDHWEQLEPYAGERGKQVVPHLTVTTSRPPRVFDLVDEALVPLLPIESRIDSAQLYLFDGRRWTEHASFALGRVELEYTVKRVPVERTFALRKSVLRPYLDEDEPYSCADDHLPATVALAALTADDRVIGVARITPEPPPFETAHARSWRLRGMAASPEVRNMGVGSALLQGLIAHIGAEGGGILWCNARISARGLYERGGMRAWGEPWEDPQIGPHIVMWRDIH